MPEVKFVKGKWNELNGPNYVIDANTEASFQIGRVFGMIPMVSLPWNYKVNIMVTSMLVTDVKDEMCW